MNIHDLILVGDAEGLAELLRTHPNPSTLLKLNDAWWKETPLFTALRPSPVNLDIVGLLLEAGADPNGVRIIERSGWTDRELAVVHMLRHGDIELLKLFEKHGARLEGNLHEGYTAILDALYTDKDPTAVVEHLLEQGHSPNAKSSYNETPLTVALGSRRFGLVKLLLASGAEEPVGFWNPLIKACAVGTLSDVERALSNGANLEERSATGLTALQIALRRGDRGIAKALLAAGASMNSGSEYYDSALYSAIQSGDPELVRWYLEELAIVDPEAVFDDSALVHAAEMRNPKIVRILLENGAHPHASGGLDSALRDALDQETILLLLDGGADPAELSAEGRRVLLGLPEAREVPLVSITKEQYLRARYEREGRANPEDMTDPFRLAMIQAGVNAYVARSRFNDESTSSCSLSWTDRPPQVWCFDRFGQTFTQLPDGRTILIAGEHEDWYDPDFCIYNDVTVFFPDGQIKVFGYPYSVFETTDFHTATLVGDFIWIIGGLGYVHQREGQVPVYRLDTRDYSIQKVEMIGEVPSRFYSHRATLVNGSQISIQLKSPPNDGIHRANQTGFFFDTVTRTWTQAY